MRAARRIQLSSWFGPKYAAVDPNVAPTFLPIFWAEETSQVGCDKGGPRGAQEWAGWLCSRVEREDGWTQGGPGKAERRRGISPWTRPACEACIPGLEPCNLRRPIPTCAQAKPEQMEAFRPLLEARQLQAALRRWHWTVGAALVGLGTLTLLVAAAGAGKLAPGRPARSTAAAAAAGPSADPEAAPLLHTKIDDGVGEEIEPLP